MSTIANCYSVLGVSPKSSFNEIKTAYRALARSYHPDLNPNDQAAEEQLKTINAAYGMLCDRFRQSANTAPRSVAPNATYDAFVEGLMGFTR